MTNLECSLVNANVLMMNWTGIISNVLEIIWEIVKQADKVCAFYTSDDAKSKAIGEQVDWNDHLYELNISL